MEYKSYNDETLISLLSEGDEFALLEIQERYKRNGDKLGGIFAFTYLNSGVSKEELSSVCFTSFFVTLSTYMNGSETFYTLWKIISIHEMAKYMNQNSYFARAHYFFGAISLDDEFDDGRLVAETFSLDEDDSKTSTIKNEILKGYSKAILDECDNIQKFVWKMKFEESKTFDEIAYMCCFSISKTKRVLEKTIDVLRKSLKDFHK